MRPGSHGFRAWPSSFIGRFNDPIPVLIAHQFRDPPLSRHHRGLHDGTRLPNWGVAALAKQDHPYLCPHTDIPDFPGSFQLAVVRIWTPDVKPVIWGGWTLISLILG